MNQSEQESLGSIQTRVSHLEQGLIGISKDMREGFSLITKQIQDQASRFDTERRPQWQAYGLVVTIALAFSGFVWWVNTDRQNAMALQFGKSNDAIATLIAKMDDSKVDVATYNVGAERARETRQNQEKAIDGISAKMVPFEVHKIQWDAQAAANLTLQRQIDELKKGQSDTYSARDVILDLKSRQRELEDMMLRGRATP